MTEQTGQNSEVLPDIPAVNAEVDPQQESATIGPQHDPVEQAVEECAVVEAAAAEAGSGEPEAVAEVASPEPGSEMMAGQAGASGMSGIAEMDSSEPVQRIKAAGSVRRRGESAKSRKAAAAAPVVSDVPKSENMNWYILKVQSNREESIREGLLRRVSIQGLDRYFGEVIVPTEKVTEFKAGKKRVIKRKLYPGYLVVHMEINEDTWFLVRETPGIGDFTGASGVPSVMLPHEVERIIAKQEEKSEKAPDLKIPFVKGDRVKVIEGNFENFEGEVDAIDKTNGRVTVMITIFNRTTPVEFEYWQVESV